ncbi:MAG TPA: glycosyltransferase [Rhizomicrobium sp.]|nr:glycosyltransferase [Rhizomicrobium sp.]
MYRLHRGIRKALILSPTASHPQDYGNRNRVYQTTAFLKRQGHEIHFVLYPVEPDWRKGVPASARAMRTEWDSFTVVPTTGAVQPPAVAEYHLIDEWWDPSIEAYLKWLFEHEFFDVFVVNYAFLSKAFELAPKATAKILETHDRFSGRKELLTALGAPLEAFYTTEDQEATALNRSDIVVAIKESEAKFYQALTTRHVISVPFWPGEKEGKARAEESDRGDRKLRAGFVGALNVVNVANMSRFLESFEKYCASQPVTLDVAGEVCTQLSSKCADIRLLGRVDDLDHFYDGIDVVVAPLMFSTGLKIKVAEALAYGKAVVSTANGFDGFEPRDEFHSLESIDDVSRALARLARDHARFERLRANSVAAAAMARRQSAGAYEDLMRSVGRLSCTTVLLTDTALGVPDGVPAIRLTQWAELCSQITPTVVVLIGADVAVSSGSGLDTVDVAEIHNDGNAVESVLSLLGEIEQSSEIVQLVISVSGRLGEELWKALRQSGRNITLDNWHPALAALSSSELPPPTFSDIWIGPSPAGDRGVHLSVSAFRRLPRQLQQWKTMAGKGTVVVRCGAEDHDERGIELLLSKARPDHGVQVVSLSRSEDFSRRFFDDLAACGRPEILLAVGEDWRGHSVCRTVGLLTGTPCLVLASSRFPVPVKRNDGRLVLCCSYADIARYIASPNELSRASPQHHEGTGWMTYSRLLARRTRQPAPEAADSSPLPLNQILLRGIPHALARLVG